MTLIEVSTPIAAPVERCFEPARSIDLHLATAAATGERVVAGRASGLIGGGETVTWEGRHLARVRRLAVELTRFDAPRGFRDEQVEGPFRRFVHDHLFEPHEGGTLMIDRLDAATWLPPFDRLVLAPYLRRFVAGRADALRRTAEGDDRRRYLG